MPLIPASDLPIEQYHLCAPSWLSKTSIRDFSDFGPAWWHRTYILRDIPRRKPGGVEQGLALDAYLTEGPDAYASRFAVRPPGIDGRTKEGKAWLASVDGKVVLSAEDEAILMDAVAAVRSHPLWPEIEACAAQVTVRRESSTLGIGLQSRPDWLNALRGVLFDLKKTRDLASFGRQSIDLGYHLQAAVAGWCLAGDGIGLEHAYLVAVEWERGARCRVYEIPHEALDAGDRLMRSTASEIARRIQDDDWTDHPPTTAEPLPIPEWMRRNMESI
jgi:hypothetical protein